MGGGVTRPPIGCGNCDARWWGTTLAHCSQCHVTFGGVAPFDAHQINGKCLNVRASRNFFQAREGVWSFRTGVQAKTSRKAPTAPKKGHS